MEPINCQQHEFVPSGGGHRTPLPESPRVPMEFLSRSWSASALEVTKAIAPAHSQPPFSSCMPSNGSGSIPEETSIYSISEELSTMSKNQFSFASSATSQLVLERIMSHSAREEVSPLTSGRLSHSSEPLNGNGSLTGTDSPPVSHSDEFDDVVKFFRANNSIHPLFNGGRANGAIGNVTAGSGPKTVGRWLKERREKKKEENRTHNAQMHATITVAAVAAAIAAIAAATAASSTPNKDEKMAKTDVAVASAATLVAAQCVEAAEAMGAERDHLASVVSSAVNVRSHDDISTLTAAAATALRGAATLKARAQKDVWNIAAVTPLEKGIGGITISGKGNNIKNSNSSTSDSGEIINADNFTGSSIQELLAKGSELLKRTRNGDLHWKIVSVYIHRTGQVNAYQPWIWTVGNHEIDFAPEIGETKPFKPFSHRYRTPYKASQSTSPFWYSIKRASAHIIVLASYSAYGKYTPQYKWLEQELPKVNRTETPWLIVLMHSPWYNSYNYHYMEGETMRVMYEPWFVKYKVDVVYAGHVHAYERSERVSNVAYNIVNGICTPIKDESAPVYITIGDGGNLEGLATNMTEPQPAYSAFREASFGHAIFDIKNRTHAHYSWHRNQDGENVEGDSLWFFNRFWHPFDDSSAHVSH